MNCDDAPAARRQLLEAIEAGCTHLVLAPLRPWPPSPAAWLAEQVIEPVLAETTG